MSDAFNPTEADPKLSDKQLDLLRKISLALYTAASGSPSALAAGSNIIGKVGIDQTTPGTTNGVAVTSVLPAGENLIGKVAAPADLVDITFTLDTSAYASGDVLADTQVVANAVRVADGQAILQSLVLIDEDDQKVALDLLFFSGSGTLGTENAAPSISDANARNFLGRVQIASGEYGDLGGVSVVTKSGLGLMVEAASGTRDIYVAALNGTGTPTYTASGLKLRLGFLW